MHVYMHMHIHTYTHCDVATSYEHAHMLKRCTNHEDPWLNSPGCYTDAALVWHTH
jgi:hypothetical protein